MDTKKQMSFLCVKLLLFILVINFSSSYQLRNLQTSPTTPQTEGPGNSTVPNLPPKQKKSGLSTGGICAVVIPCAALLLGVAGLSLFLGGSSAAAAGTGAGAGTLGLGAPMQNINYIDTSLNKFQPVPQQVQVVQPVQPVQVVETVTQPVQVETVVQPVQPVQVVTEVQPVP